MPFLCVQVRCGKLNPANIEDAGTTYIVCRIDHTETRTRLVKGLTPLYDYCNVFEVPSELRSIQVEVWTKKIFRSYCCSMAVIDLSNALFRNKCQNGQWYQLKPLDPSGGIDQLCLDIHFQLPNDPLLSPLERAALEDKVNKLNNVLLNEMDTLKHQSQKTFTDIKDTVSRSRPGTQHKKLSKTHSPNDSFMTLDSSSDYHDAETNADSGIPGSINDMASIMSATEQRSQRSSISYSSVSHRSNSIVSNAVSSVASSLPLNNDSVKHNDDVTPGNTHSRSTSQFSLFSDDVENEMEEELSEGAKLWLNAIDRLRRSNYLKPVGDELENGEQVNGVHHQDSVEDDTSLSESEGTPLIQKKEFWDVTDSSIQQIIGKISKNTAKPTRSQEQGDMSHSIFNIQNYEALKPHVFTKTIQALIYPISQTEPHKFDMWSTMTPAYCYECEGLLWGFARQGMKCQACGVKCHEKCQDLLNADCLQRAAEKSSRGETEDAAQHKNIMNSISQRMKVTENSSADTFELLRNSFGYEQEYIKNIKESVKKTILDGSSKWSAKLDITVVEAQGLIGKDKSGTSDPYVTVTVGKTKKTTKTIPQDLNPKWDDNFSFECHNSSDRIKVRVWDEDDDLKSKVMAHLKREADDFLGQAIIEVRKLCGVMDVWYDLKQRTDRSAVSGTIHLRMSVKVEGEEQMVSYHVQYQILHELLFKHMCNVNDGVKIPATVCKNDDDSWKIYFDEPAQYVVNEFATRYGIEDIFKAMTHFSCLAHRYIVKKDAPPQVVSQLLAQINAYYRDASGVGQDKFSATNFGKQKFVSILDKLQMSLKMDLATYKSMFPSDRPDRLKDLENTIALITSIVFFRIKVLQQDGASSGANSNLPRTPPATAIIMDRVKACLRSTYTYIREHTEEIYDNQYQLKQEPVTGARAGLNHWNKFILLIIMEIKEDKTVYHRIFVRFFNLTDMSASTLWEDFAKDLQKELHENEEQYLKDVTSSEMMMFQMTVKYLYDEYVAPTPEYEGKLPEYPTWFEQFVMRHLSEIHEQTLKSILVKALEKDELVPVSELTKHSSSVVDIFGSLTVSHEMLHKLNCPVPALRDKYLNRFCETINSVLVQYAQKTVAIFKNNVKNMKTACVLLSNIHQLREELESLFKKMGGESLDIEARKTLENTQVSLAKTRNELIVSLVDSMVPSLEGSVVQIKQDLRKIRSNNKTEAMEQILAPLLEYLDIALPLFAASCHKSILKRVLRATWDRTLTLLEQFIILPEITANCALEEVQELNSKQSQFLEDMLNGLKLIFTDKQCGEVLKQSTLEKTQKMRWLKQALERYRKSTDALIKYFIEHEVEQDKFAAEDSQGEIQLQVDLFTSPGQEYHECTVKVVSASRLHWNTVKMFRPFVEVNLIGPKLSPVKRRYQTKWKNKNFSPTFNEAFQFKITKPSDPVDYELQFSVKDYCFLKTDLLVGVTVMPLRNVVETGSFQDRLDLGRSLYISEEGRSIVIILSQRIHDEVSREFVQLKLQERSEIV